MSVTTTREVKNAKIESTVLGFEGHGLMSFMIQLTFPPGGQGFGNYRLDTWDKALDRSVGTAWGMEAIIQILRVVGVEKWEDLKGKHVRIDGNWGKIHRIGHILEDKWFEPEADLKFLAPALEKGK